MNFEARGFTIKLEKWVIPDLKEDEEASILRIKWIQGQGQLAVLLDNWSIELFKIAPLQNAKNGQMSLIHYAKYQWGMNIIFA